MDFEWTAVWAWIEARLVPLVTLLVLVLVVWIAHWIVFRLAARWAGRSRNDVDDLLVRWLRRPTRWLAPELVVLLLLPTLQLGDAVEGFLQHALAIAVILSVAWLVRNGFFILRDLILRRHDISQADNLKARQVHTQVRVIQRVVSAVIIVVAAAAVLMTFEQVRQIGVSLLASAGVLGIILGFAAQQSISTLFAGLQIAITQPIRLDDVVIVEGEWGRIEEITLTFVVVRIWDLRRLVVPVKYFIEKPFQHWTRVSADILGTVYLYADWRLPVDDVREELKRILEKEPDWDGNVAGLVVTDTSERGIAVRALMSASDAGKAWDLRCAVREKLIAYVQQNHPECLPRFRAEMEPREGDGEGGPGRGAGSDRDRGPGVVPASHAETLT